jgi:hypothetical protein
MAHHVGHSTTERPSDPVGWPTGWANRLPRTLQIRLNGPLGGPIGYRKAFRSGWMAHWVGHSTTERPSDPLEWLTTWAIRLPKGLQIRLDGPLGGPFDYRKTLESSSMAHWVGQSPAEKPSDPLEWPTGWANHPPRSPQTHLTGSLDGPFDYRKTLESSSMAHWLGQSTTERPSNSLQWPTGWANRLPKGLQIRLNGPLDGPIDYRKTLESSSMAHWMGQSVTEKPSDPVEWPTGWAIRLRAPGMAFHTGVRVPCTGR